MEHLRNQSLTQIWSKIWTKFINTTFHPKLSLGISGTKQMMDYCERESLFGFFFFKVMLKVMTFSEFITPHEHM